MVIYAMDPSFNALAYSLYDGKDKIYIDKSSYELGTNIGFDKILIACRNLWESHITSLSKIGVGNEIKIEKAVSEFAPPTSQFSAGLFSLDTFIISNMFDTFTSIQEFYGVPSSYLSTVHNHAKYTKSDSTKLAKYFINEVFPNEFEIIIPDNISEKGRKTKGTINNDKAESFLFLLRMFVKYDIHNLAKKIQSEMSGLGYESEKLLLSR